MKEPELGHFQECPWLYLTTPAGNSGESSVLPPRPLRTFSAPSPYFYADPHPYKIPYFCVLRSFLFCARLQILAYWVRDARTAAAHRCKHLSEADIR